MRLKTETTNLLHELGMPAHLSGFEYLREAVVRCVRDPDMVRQLTKRLYPDVAKEFSSTPSRTERAMRHAVAVAFDRGELERLHTLFGCTVRADKGKPTVGEFIGLVADTLRLKMEAEVWQN